jgi:type II secretory pathway pseudopilin PulG
MTMLEILIVLGVMGLLLVLGRYTVNAVAKTGLRSTTVEVAAALKAARNLSSQSGMNHRVVFNLDQQTYQIEVCPDPIQMQRGGKEEDRPDREALAGLAEHPDPMGGKPGMQPGLGAASTEVSGAESPEQALKASAALAGLRVGTSRCGVSAAVGGDGSSLRQAQGPNVHKLEGGGVSMRRIYVQHLDDPVDKGEVSINFFPLGQAEKAMIELVDTSGDQFTVLLYGLTGQVEVRDGEVDPDVHMRRDATGDEVDER